MRKLKIVFMGTPDFAVGSLSRIVNSDYELVGVVTAPDKPAGRGRKISESAVKKYALEHAIPILQPVKLRDPEFIEELKALEANVFIVVAFRMLPEIIWKLPEYGTINLHASLLPDYRGAAPINWAVINGERETGVTTFYINEKIDTGEIILQEATSIGANESAGGLHDRLMELGAELVLKTLTLIAKGEVETKVQSYSKEYKTAPKIYKDSCRIVWDKGGTQVFDHIRGLSPYPGAWTRLYNGEQISEVKIFKADLQSVNHTDKPGKIYADKKTIKVAVENGYITLLEIQLAGKRRMTVGELLNGLKIDKEAHMS
ncbi:MAG: methionyl-tRNA formyltransferase [Flavobacteriaceae bacterium]